MMIYAKDFRENNGWGKFYGCMDPNVRGGIGDKYIPRYFLLDTKAHCGNFHARLHAKKRVRIYQLFVRLFGNTNETRKVNGTVFENGVGKFSDINDAALTAVSAMNFTHVWLTGVLRQATATDHSATGAVPDDPDLLKGLAGSPYAIRSYFDVCPDYALDPKNRLEEFKELVARMHAHGLKVITDLVPNHVARSYHSDIAPEHDFGVSDDKSKFFDVRNNFFYLRADDPGGGPPLKLPTFSGGEAISPTCKVLGKKCDGFFDGEMNFGRVTGNNVVSWAPQLSDWYETAKLNFGYDFTTDERAYPYGEQPDRPLPDTWLKMDRILEYWQNMGVDGFRCDMAHMVPPEFWAWAIGHARARDPDAFFMGEAYDDDPGKMFGTNPVLRALNGGRGNVMFDLLNSGFSATYDDPGYKALKNIYDGPGWANDLDRVITNEFIFQNGLRYAENHDEVRLAGKRNWSEIGMEVGRPVAAILYGLGRGPVMLYNGQEVGEPAHGVEGFGGDDARTTIFDYWSMPEFTKWVNGHKFDGGRLSDAQKSLREFYIRLIALVGEPAFSCGDFFPLNSANADTARFGTVDGDPSSGHWMYAFLRSDAQSGQRFLVVANLHRSVEFQNVRLRFSSAALEAIGYANNFHFVERLSGGPTLDTNSETLTGSGLEIPSIPPLTPFYFEVSTPPRG